MFVMSLVHPTAGEGQFPQPGGGLKVSEADRAVAEHHYVPPSPSPLSPLWAGDDSQAAPAMPTIETHQYQCGATNDMSIVVRSFAILSIRDTITAK